MPQKEPLTPWAIAVLMGIIAFSATLGLIYQLDTCKADYYRGRFQELNAIKYEYMPAPPDYGEYNR